MNKSIYKYASEAGLPIGLYLTLMSACLLMSLRVEILSMIISLSSLPSLMSIQCL